MLTWPHRLGGDVPVGQVRGPDGGHRETADPLETS
jgi:hypothetical protein